MLASHTRQPAKLSRHRSPLSWRRGRAQSEQRPRPGVEISATVRGVCDPYCEYFVLPWLVDAVRGISLISQWGASKGGVEG